MDDPAFDRAVVKAVFEQAGLRGWRDVSLIEAAQESGLDVGRLRARFPHRASVLIRFGAQADQDALAAMATIGTPRERLFDILMNRYEALQVQRPGILALLSALPTDPATALLLTGGTLNSMRWLLEGAGIPVSGLTGILRVKGLLAVWLYGLRAWQRDESADLSATMAAVDRALDRAVQAERSLPGRPPAPADPSPTT